MLWGNFPTRNARHIVNPTSLKMLIALITRNMHVIMATETEHHLERDGCWAGTGRRQSVFSVSLKIS